MSVPFFDITRQNKTQQAEIESAIATVIDSGRFILGENVSQLEKEVAAFSKTAHAVGVASGTDALHLALRACGVKAGDEIITSPFTFVATIEAISYIGATPVFVDIEPNTFNLSANLIEKKITKKTKAILPVHLYGQSADMVTIMALAKKHNLKVIEDSCQAIGAEYANQPVNSIGDAGCLSFFPTKNLGCFGDGGMVVTNNQSVADEIKVLRGHGSRKTYYYDLIGYNSRLDELQAAILRVKLKVIDRLAASRRKNAEYYYARLNNISGLQLPYQDSKAKHVFNQFTVRCSKRDALLEHLKKLGIGAMVYYPLSLHLQPVFSFLGYKAGDLPESEKAQAAVLSLPIFPELTESELDQVSSAVESFFK